MTDIVERLRQRARFDIPVAPEKLMIEAADEIERSRAALADVVKWADDLGYYADQGTVLAPVFVRAKAALAGYEQSTEGK
jgi:hypothetical protein